MSYYLSGADGSSFPLDDLDGAGGSISIAPGTPEYHKIRLEMEHIHVSVPLTTHFFKYALRRSLFHEIEQDVKMKPVSVVGQSQ